ncbi:nuclear transport factor 2 family protein [Variovorax sp. OV329]|uniref:nuclear transport factor 2 family protein n=1 Tax=Variovorax sp. OV329 TaxID=1882825 RepID=UPI0015876CC7|nr:nuclear transport factor 2 family protein [Variovorax sp. OV329]
MENMDFACDPAPTDAISTAMAAILALEDRLDAAMRAGDVEALDQLLAEDLMFTGNHGQRVSKVDDLALHRRRDLVFEQVRASDRTVRPLADAAVVTVRLDLAGRQGGRRFEGAFRFTRVWAWRDGRWQLLAAHGSRIAGGSPLDRS